MQHSEVIRFPNQPEDRLRLALRELDEALLSQSTALQEFRLNMAVLGTAVGGLEHSLERYRGTLDTVALDVAEAHQTACEAMARADALNP